MNELVAVYKVKSMMKSLLEITAVEIGVMVYRYFSDRPIFRWNDLILMSNIFLFSSQGKIIINKLIENLDKNIIYFIELEVFY